MAWTKEQQKAIDARDCSILVSAAAGSGKTAVLVERILTKIMDEEHPCDIDEFLVVTFTKAAAAQMRDKLSSRLEAALEEKPESEHLMKQLLLVNRADITTIDSFCYKLVKEHFSMLNLDSAFTVGDPGMMELMKNDVLDKLFDEKYKAAYDGQEKSDFITLIDIFAGDRDDEGLKKEILKLYNMASSYPKPEKWLNDAKIALQIDDTAALRNVSWMKKLISMIKSKINDALLLVRQGKRICEEPGGPDKNYAIVEQDEEIILGISRASDYEGLRRAMNFKWPRLATCKGDGYDMELVESYKDIRKSYKDIINGVNIFKKDATEIVSEIQVMRGYLIPLVDLTLEFMEEYGEKKASVKVMEFSDVEHMAYNLVCAGYDDDGKVIPTEIGKDIAERYSEIYIDEYQDSNYLQEDILCSVSGLYRGIYNMFMVGDVKQSIYRFRMARPDLFIKKYDRFTESGNEIKIELKANFRSREVVLLTANYFFYQLMGRDLGGIEYNDNIALVPAKEFPKQEKDGEKSISTETEILIADYNSDDKPIDNVVDKMTLEAYMIADRIKELVDEKNGFSVYDEELGRYRRAKYRDIVILGRSIKGFGESVYNALASQGIPVYLDDTKGYFDAVEIRVIMSLLAVVDNCRQDIEFSAMLLSPIGGITENELAVICDYASKQLGNVTCLYDKCICYSTDMEDSVSEKLNKILDLIAELKEDKIKMSISGLIWKALQITGYYTYASAMPMGEKRKANIDMLLEKADSFENGYYKGLFNFLRYVDKLKLNEVDFGEANLLGDEDDVVRIMTMHKSKGLEYPIVFVSGLGKGFNRRDSKEALILHSDYYMASTIYNTGLRYRKGSFIKDAFKMLISHENMAEELRILYVAMTRAKEKLILTGCDSDLEKVGSMFEGIKDQEELLLPYITRQQSKSFLYLVMACMVRYNTLGQKLCKDMLRVKKYDYADIVASVSQEVTARGNSMEELLVMTRQISEDEILRQYGESFDFVYPYKAFTEIKSKMSISEIKKMKAYDGQGYDVSEEFENIEYEDDEKEQNEKRCDTGAGGSIAVGGASGLSGAERGTIVHKYMELFPFADMEQKKDYRDNVKLFLKKLREDEIFDECQMQAINPFKISRMLGSSLGQRMIAADKEGNLHKEQQFSVGIHANDIYENLPETEDVVIVQGIIDAYFCEDNEIVLVDYKTDKADEETLVGRYRAQLDYYGRTLEQLTGCKVKEKIIYSFYLNREISL